jgi:hypothetical protein
MYMHNYIIGSLVSEMTINFLDEEFGGNFEQWGKWLKCNYYADGRGRSLQEKVAVIGDFPN